MYRLYNIWLRLTGLYSQRLIRLVAHLISSSPDTFERAEPFRVLIVQ